MASNKEKEAEKLIQAHSILNDVAETGGEWFLVSTINSEVNAEGELKECLHVLGKASPNFLLNVVHQIAKGKPLMFMDFIEQIRNGAMEGVAELLNNKKNDE